MWATGPTTWAAPGHRGGAVYRTEGRCTRSSPNSNAEQQDRLFSASVAEGLFWGNALNPLEDQQLRDIGRHALEGARPQPTP